MAEKRMFAKTIIDSDVFLEMPLSTQALYFHLSMRADDEGFLNNPRKIQRMIGASDDDLKLLAMKKFIITFDTGVVVIKHWRINNYLQKDRVKPTIFQKELAMLGIKPSKAYTLNFDDPSTRPLIGIQKNDKKSLPDSQALDTDSIHDVSKPDTECIQPCIQECVQDVSNMYTERIQDGYSSDTDCIHIAHNAIDKNRENTEKNKLSTICIQDGYSSYTQDRIDIDKINKLIINPILSIDGVQKNLTDLVNEIISEWNLLSELGVKPLRILGPTTERFKLLVANLQKYGLQSFKTCCDNIRASEYLLGKTDARRTAIDFDWLVKEDHYAYVLEGKYDKYTDLPTRQSKGNRNFLPSIHTYDNVDFSELEKQLLDN